jgi:tetratricopeptide (TPR) repeat protein
MQKLEGKLTVEPRATDQAALDEAAGATSGPPSATGSGIPIEQAPPPPAEKGTGTPALQMDGTGSNASAPGATAAAPADAEGGTRVAGTEAAAAAAPVIEGHPDNESTQMITADDERTVMYEGKELIEEPPAGESGGSSGDPFSVEMSPPDAVEIKADPMIANEKTAMLTLAPPTGKQSAANKGFLGNLTPKKKKILVALIIVCVGMFVLAPDDDSKKQPGSDVEIPFRVELPAPTDKADSSASEKAFKKGLTFYNEDTVEGYKNAARQFSRAATLDSNNVRALCMLASSYMNLFDVVKRDEGYFAVITRLIELARAKGLDFGETVIADVELYLMLGNPEAAFNRIVEYSKSHPSWGMEMLYYLALCFYAKAQYPDALQQLNKIDFQAYTSPRVPYLFGQIFDKNNQPEEALKAYNVTVQRSPKHIKARIKLAELYFRKDNLPESGKHADFVIHHQTLASQAELAKAYYFRARMHMVASRDLESLQDLEFALKNSPEDPDILLDYYTLKAKTGGKVKDAAGKAKMFNFLALGEKSLKEGKLKDALANFLTARDALYDDPTPLIRLAEVYRRLGDLQASKSALEKAVKLAPKKPDVYPKYIQTLIDAWEIEDAANALLLYKEIAPGPAIVDKLQGELYLKQEKYKEALAYLKRGLTSANVDASIYVAYATLMYKVNNFQDAAFYYGLALRFDPFNTEATIGIGKSFAEMQGVEKGVEYVQGALQLSPYKAALLNGIAEIYAKKGDNDQALKYAENALTVDPQFALAHKTRGDAYAGKERRKEAADAYLTYTNLAPLDPSGHLKRYELFIKPTEKGEMDLKGAKVEIEKVLSVFPKYPGAYYMLGDLYRIGQNWDSSLTAAQMEIKNNPSYIPAYVLAGLIYNEKKDYINALTVLSKAVKFAPNYVPGLLQAGRSNLGLKNYPAAQSMLERAVSLDSGNPQIYKSLGVLYYELNNLDKMKEALKKYLEMYPDAPDKNEVQEYLKKAGG